MRKYIFGWRKIQQAKERAEMLEDIKEICFLLSVLTLVALLLKIMGCPLLN